MLLRGTIDLDGRVRSDKSKDLFDSSARKVVVG